MVCKYKNSLQYSKNFITIAIRKRELKMFQETFTLLTTKNVGIYPYPVLKCAHFPCFDGNDDCSTRLTS